MPNTQIAPARSRPVVPIVTTPMVFCRLIQRETKMIYAAETLFGSGKSSCELCRDNHQGQYACKQK